MSQLRRTSNIAGSNLAVHPPSGRSLHCIRPRDGFFAAFPDRLYETARFGQRLDALNTRGIRVLACLFPAQAHETFASRAESCDPVR